MLSCANGSLAVHAAVGSNTYAIYGAGADKELTELVPGILSQLGSDAITNLRKIAESYQTQQGAAGAMGPGGLDKEADEEDDEAPALVEATEVSLNPRYRRGEADLACV